MSSGAMSSDSFDTSELWQRVVNIYDKAQDSGAATKTKPKVELFKDEDYGVEFVLRLAEILKSKPKGDDG